MSTQPSRSMRREPPFRKSRTTNCCNFHLGLAGWLIPIPGLFARVGHIDRRIQLTARRGAKPDWGEMMDAKSGQRVFTDGGARNVLRDDDGRQCVIDDGE